MTNSGPTPSPQRTVRIARRPGFRVGFTATVGLTALVLRKLIGAAPAEYPPEEMGQVLRVSWGVR